MRHIFIWKESIHRHRLGGFVIPRGKNAKNTKKRKKCLRFLLSIVALVQSWVLASSADSGGGAPVGALPGQPILTRVAHPTGEASSRAAGVSDPWSDARFQRWAKDFSSQERRGLLDSVSADLADADPHPLAGYVWVVTHAVIGDLKNAWQDLPVDGTLRKRLAAIKDIYLLRAEGRPAEALAHWPVANVRDIQDYSALLSLAWAAHEAGRENDRADYLLAAQEVLPNTFAVASGLWFAASSDDRVRARIAGCVAHGGALEGSPAGNFLSHMLNTRLVGNLEQIAQVNLWLETKPRDPDALRFRANAENMQERQAAASRDYLESEEINPFDTESWGYEVVRMLEAQHESVKAREVLIALVKRVRGDPAQVPSETERLWAGVLNSLGRKADAVKAFAEARMKWPENARLCAWSAELALATGRRAVALADAREAVRLEPANLEYRVRLLQALDQSGEFDDARSLIRQIDSGSFEKSMAFYSAACAFFARLNSPEEGLACADAALKLYPESIAMMRLRIFALEQAERADEALQQAESSFVIHPPDASMAGTLRTLYGRKDAATVDQEMANVRKRFPHELALWEDALSHMPGAEMADRRIALANDAVATNPAAPWSWEMLINELTMWGRRESIPQALKGMSEGVASGTLDDRVEAVWKRAISVLERACYWTPNTTEANGVPEALEALDAYRTAGGFEAAFHSARSRVFLLLKKSDMAAAELLETIRLRPDDPAQYYHLFEMDAIPEIEIFKLVHSFVERNPYDPERLYFAAERHLRWGGSPLVALHYLDLLQKRFPDQFKGRPAILEANAYGKLGETGRDFQTSYADVSAISPSDRYIDWFDASRFLAERQETKVEDINRETCTAKILGADGQIVIRRDHPVSGRLSKYQVGAAFLEFEYDADGDNITRVRSSSGDDIQFSYRSDNKLVERAVFHDGLDLLFEYNSTGKPVHITAKNTGDLFIEYDDKGAITDLICPGDQKTKYLMAARFQRILFLLQALPKAGMGQLPDLPPSDPRLEALRAKSRAAGKFLDRPVSDERRITALETRLSLAEYLADHLKDSRSYVQEAAGILQETFGVVSRANSTDYEKAGLRAVDLWRQLATKTKPQGLPSSDWNQWLTMRNWVDRLAAGDSVNHAAAFALRKESDNAPLDLLSSAEWLPRSYIDNPGFWRRFSAASMLPAAVRTNVRFLSVAQRADGSTVVGTSAGLCVFRRGFWEWFGYDETLGCWSSSCPAVNVRASSEVLATAEDKGHGLWLCTANGLMCLPNDYTEKPIRYHAMENGAANPRFTIVTPFDKGVLAGNSDGLDYFTEDGEEPFQPAGETLASIKLAKAFPLSGRKDAAAFVIVSTATGLYAVCDGKCALLLAEAVDDVLWSRNTGRLYLLRGNDFLALGWKPGEAPGELRVFPGQQKIQRSKRSFGLAMIPLDDGKVAPTVLTDQGLSIYRDGHFESRKLPFPDMVIPAENFASRNAVSAFLSGQNVFLLEKGRATIDTVGPVYDILFSKELNQTFVARGVSLEIRDPDDPSAPPDRRPLAASILVKDPLGRVITNDGVHIIRLNEQLEQEHLFDITPPTNPQGLPGKALTSLLVSRDGAIWATANASVYRWKDNRLDEYSIFKDPELFPARSDMISRILETVEGRILVIASDEAHRQYQCMPLSGGVLEWSGDRFRRTDIAGKTPAWFMTSYTPIGGDSAIVGTSMGFALQRDGRYGTFAQRADPSYLALVRRLPSLCLGTKGARLGDDVWLFGAAGGIVAYAQQRWYYPDRINWMLPDQPLSLYGARAVHAIATDDAGNIYAGTDRGLLILKGEPADPIDFLVSNSLDQDAFAKAEEDQLRGEANIILPAIDPKSEAGQQIGRIMEHRAALRALDAKIAAADEVALSPSVSDAQNPDSLRESKKKAIAEKNEHERDVRYRLTALETSNRAVFQLLDVKPLDIATKSVREALLRDDEAILQYLPTAQALYINVVTRAGVEVRTVRDLDSGKLEQEALETAQLLSQGAAHPFDPGNRSHIESFAELEDKLAWLYDKLLRPVEQDILGSKTHVYVVPYRGMTYLPFAALIRSRQPRLEYAVERFNFGCLPSMYLLDLILRHQPSLNRDALVMGAPDDSLPAAKDELQSVHDVLHSGIDCFLGDNASLENLTKYASQARVIHLATHGILDRSSPQASYLLFAHQQKLNLVNAMLLPLQNVDLAVLSACETGIGGEGMEYATMARSFAMAGAPSLVATLWKIPDQSSALLIKHFYEHYLMSSDVFTALASAQRDMLKQSAAFRHPGAWAGFACFGKP